MKETKEQWFTLEEAAEHVRRSSDQVRAWVNDKDKPLRSLRAGRGGKITIARSDLDAYVHALIGDPEYATLADRMLGDS